MKRAKERRRGNEQSLMIEEKQRGMKKEGKKRQKRIRQVTTGMIHW